MVDSAKFDINTFNKILTDLTADLTDVNLELFCDFLTEVSKLFTEMGSALSTAFQGIYYTSLIPAN